MSFCLFHRVYCQAVILLVGWITGLSPRKGDASASTNLQQRILVQLKLCRSALMLLILPKIRLLLPLKGLIFSIEKKERKNVQFLYSILLCSWTFGQMETLMEVCRNRLKKLLSAASQSQRCKKKTKKTHPTRCFHAKQRDDVSFRRVSFFTGCHTWWRHRQHFTPI